MIGSGQDTAAHVPLPKVPAAYKLTDTVSGAVYIGSAGNLRGRVAYHKSKVVNGIHPNVDFRNKVKDWENVAIEYIPCRDVQTARRVEDSLLEFNTDDGLVNVAIGDDQKPSTDGRTYRNGHFDKINALSRTEEARQLQSTVLKGRKRNEVTRQRMSDSAKVRGNNFSQEGIAKGRAKRSQPVIVDGVTYESSRAAGRAHGVCEHTAKKRANSPNFPTWSLGPKD